ncbi:MAG: SRPBCC family protein [Acidimicrobiia bacterium]
MSENAKNTFMLQRSVTIAASAAAVFEHLVDLRKWQEWSPWEGIDPNMVRTYSGAESGVGAVYEWTGNRKVGAGRMTVVEVDVPNSLGIRLEFIKPFKATNMAQFELLPVSTGGETQVTWSMTGKKTLMTKVMGIFKSMDAMVGPDFEKGLAQLKARCEATVA